MKTRVICSTPPSDISKGSFLVQLPTTLVGVKHIKLLNAVVPSVSYNIEAGYTDQFLVRVGSGAGSINLTEGAYSITELFEVLTRLLNDTWPLADFSFSYSPQTFHATLGSSLDFQILDAPRSMAHLLGFVQLPTLIDRSHTGKAAVRLNSQRWVVMDLDIPGACSLYAPLSNSMGSFMLPLYAANTDISYLGPQDLQGQEVDINPGSDVSRFEIQLKRLDTNRKYQLTADTSFLLEFTHDS